MLKPHRDEGSALIITLMVMMLVGALATSIAVVAVNGLRSSTLARNAGVALDASNAGLSEGLSYLRTNGVVAIDLCPTPTSPDPEAAGFTAFDLGSQGCVNGLGDARVRPVSGQPYTVLIASKTDYAAGVTGEYVIVARGTGPVRATRAVSADVEATGVGAAVGAFQGNMVALGGQTPIQNQSVFSRGCVYKRSLLTMSGTDAYGLPAAVHSESYITDDQGTSITCPHPSKIYRSPSSPCNTGNSGQYKYDQDVAGGLFGPTSSCMPANPGHYYDTGSKLGTGDLEKVYGIKFPPLTPDDIERLRATARTQGNLMTDADLDRDVTPNGTQAVLFYQLANPWAQVDLSQIKGFDYTNGMTCLRRSLVVVVEGGDAVQSRNNVNPIIASIFVVTPGKKYDSKGGGVVGSVSADYLFLGGATIVDSTAQDCANSNPSPSTMTFKVTSYRELDG